MLSLFAAIQARLHFPTAIVSLWKYTNELQVFIFSASFLDAHYGSCGKLSPLLISPQGKLGDFSARSP
jgi:hypothetical protein